MLSILFNKHEDCSQNVWLLLIIFDNVPVIINKEK